MDFPGRLGTGRLGAARSAPMNSASQAPPASAAGPSSGSRPISENDDYKLLADIRTAKAHLQEMRGSHHRALVRAGHRRALAALKDSTNGPPSEVRRAARHSQGY
jgi:hypothetical protein